MVDFDKKPRRVVGMKPMSPEEKIAFLEKRHELILNWLQNQANRCRKAQTPILTQNDFAFSMMYHEDIQDAVRESARKHHECDDSAATYEYIIATINNGTKDMLKKFEEPSNEYEI